MVIKFVLRDLRSYLLEIHRYLGPVFGQFCGVFSSPFVKNSE